MNVRDFENNAIEQKIPSESFTAERDARSTEIFVAEKMKALDSQWEREEEVVTEIQNTVQEGHIIENGDAQTTGILQNIAESFKKSKTLKAAAFATVVFSAHPAFGAKVDSVVKSDQSFNLNESQLGHLPQKQIFGDFIAGSADGADWTSDEVRLNSDNKIESDRNNSFEKKRDLKEVRELRQEAEQVRHKAIEHMSGDAYLQKLMIEFDNDVKKAKEEQRARIDNVASVVIHPYEKIGGKQDKLVIEEDLKVQKIDTAEAILSEGGLKQIFEVVSQQKNSKEYLNNMGVFSEEDFIKRILSSQVEKNELVESFQGVQKNKIRRILQDKMSNFDGYYATSKHSISIRPNVDFENILYHELMHASTRFEQGVTDKTKKTLNKSFKEEPRQTIFSSNLSGDVGIDYLKNVSERLVRKQQLDKQLQKLGIKNYEDEFTKVHYDQMMEAHEQEKFSEDADQFINTTDPDFETYKEIFDTIADTETQKNDNEMAA